MFKSVYCFSSGQVRLFRVMGNPAGLGQFQSLKTVTTYNILTIPTEIDLKEACKKYTALTAERQPHNSFNV